MHQQISALSHFNPINLLNLQKCRKATQLVGLRGIPQNSADEQFEHIVKKSRKISHFLITILIQQTMAHTIVSKSTSAL